MIRDSLEIHQISVPKQTHLPFSLTTTFMQMTLSSSSLSTHSTLTHLQNAIQQISSSIAANLLKFLPWFLLLTPLRLNSQKQLATQFFTWQLTSPTLLEILASFLTNILITFSDQTASFSKAWKPVTITFVNFAVSGFTSIRQLPHHCYLCDLSFTPSLMTVILSTVNNSSLNYLVSSISQTCDVVKAPVPKYHSHHTPSTGSESLNASNNKLHSLTYKVLATTQLPYLHPHLC